MTTPASLRALCSEMIDYAGLFPPAKLPLEEAVRNFARYRTEAEQWMLSRFVIPAARLDDLNLFREELFSEGPPLRLSVLLPPITNPAELINEVTTSLSRIASFEKTWGSAAEVGALEGQLPEVFAESEQRESAGALLSRICEMLGNAVPGPVLPYFELADSHPQLISLLGGLPQRVGFKLRCGGNSADAVPSVETVASVIVGCREAGVPFKLTAGLHHPLRHDDVTLGAPVHGFLNIFVAAVLSEAQSLESSEVIPILEERAIGAFRFSEEGLAWKDQTASLEEIRAARERILSVGSCSFDEPRADLRGLGLID